MIMVIPDIVKESLFIFYYIYIKTAMLNFLLGERGVFIFYYIYIKTANLKNILFLPLLCFFSVDLFDFQKNDTIFSHFIQKPLISKLLFLCRTSSLSSAFYFDR